MSGLVDRLHELERKVIISLRKKKVQSVDELALSSELNRDAVLRAILWLSSKGLINVKNELIQLISLSKQGFKYSNSDLPEIAFLKLIKSKPVNISDMKGKLSNDELNVALGILRRAGCISFVNGVASITSVGKELLSKKFPEKELISKLSSGPVDMSVLSDSLKGVVDLLIKRGLIEVSHSSNKFVSLTSEGLKVSKDVKVERLIEQLTPEMLKDGSWVNGKFRAYDVTSPVPRSFPGKKHFLYQVMELIKGFFTEMGFYEMRSNYVESCFWNYDVMFFPQDHPDRGTMDTFYLDTDLKGKVPVDYASIISKVQESGWTTGSKGRRMGWDIDESRKLILRCHTTQTSFRYLAKKLIPPYKFFSIDRVFRNESKDATHLPEFHQVEGFVVGDGLTFRNLLGNLREFYYKMGIKQIKFKPTFNPYTEPSMEIHGYFPGIKKWKALGNSGVFRPEVLKPLGIDSPVIAWGLGLERIAMFIYDLMDVRQCVGHTVDFNTIRTKELLTRIRK